MTSQNLLWEGNISQKWICFVKSRYAEIYADKIIIKKKKDTINTEIEIRKHNIVSVELPKFGATEALLTGFRGFNVKFKSDASDQIKNISFWTRGFGAYPNTETMKTLTPAMSTFIDREITPEEITSSANVFNIQTMMLYIIPIMIGFLMLGFIGAIEMGFGAFFTSLIQSNKNLSSTKKLIFSILILGTSFVITLISMFVIGFLLFSAGVYD